jgi:hypothetical protein
MLDEAIEAYNKDQQENSLFRAVMVSSIPILDLMQPTADQVPTPWNSFRQS